MKHTLSSFRRSFWLQVTLIVVLGIMCAPLGVMAATTGAGTPLATGGLNPIMLGAIGLGAFGILRSPASDDGDAGGGDGKLDLAAAVAQIEDKTLPISQRLSVAVQALKGIDPTQQLASIKQHLTDANASIALKDGEITKLKAELDTAQKTLTAREKDVSELEASNAQLENEANTLRAKEQDIDKRAEQKSKEHVASLGFPASNLPAPQGADDMKTIPATEAEMEQKLEACKNQGERSSLLRAYKASKAQA
jgi:hypothetical protein